MQGPTETEIRLGGVQRWPRRLYIRRLRGISRFSGDVGEYRATYGDAWCIALTYFTPVDRWELSTAHLHKHCPDGGVFDTCSPTCHVMAHSRPFTLVCHGRGLIVSDTSIALRNATGWRLAVATFNFFYGPSLT